MICHDCAELVDILIGEFGKVGKTGKPETDRILNCCPKCNGDNNLKWGTSNPCPKCDGKMIKLEGDIILWD